MNAARRNTIADIIALLEQAQGLLEDVITDEQAAFDNMPEGLQASDRGVDMEDGISVMDDALSNINEALAQLA